MSAPIAHIAQMMLRLIVTGRRMKEIAAVLDLSARTVETHRYEMMRVLGVQSTAELIWREARLVGRRHIRSFTDQPFRNFSLARCEYSATDIRRSSHRFPPS